MCKPSCDCLADRSKAVLLLWIPLLFMFHGCICYTILFVPCSLVITCCELAALLALLCVVFSCVFFITFPYGVPGQVWCLIVSIPHLYLPILSQIVSKYYHIDVIKSNLLKPDGIEKGVFNTRTARGIENLLLRQV